VVDVLDSFHDFHARLDVESGPRVSSGRHPIGNRALHHNGFRQIDWAFHSALKEFGSTLDRKAQLRTEYSSVQPVLTYHLQGEEYVSNLINQ
jgi:hypothetical protein